MAKSKNPSKKLDLGKKTIKRLSSKELGMAKGAATPGCGYATESHDVYMGGGYWVC